MVSFLSVGFDFRVVSVWFVSLGTVKTSHGAVKARSVPPLGHSSGCSIAGPPCGVVTPFWAAVTLPGENQGPEDELDHVTSGQMC